jgi:hypothetical protein
LLLGHVQGEACRGARTALGERERKGAIMSKQLAGFLGMACALFVALAPRPAAAFAINWSTPGVWQWFGAGCTSGMTSSNTSGNWGVSWSCGGTLDYTPTCMDGSATGIAVRVPSNWNGKVMYWLDGGGYCFDKPSCANQAPNATQIAADFASGQLPLAPFVFRKNFPFGPASDTTGSFEEYATAPAVGTLDLNLMAQQKATLAQGIFDQTTSTNPFYEYLQVFVPYCTGDLFLGYNSDSGSAFGRDPSGVNFVGLTNAMYAIDYSNYYVTQKLGHVPTRSVIAGGSAGGFGAMLGYGWWRYAINLTSGGSSEKIVTISDSGTLYYTGFPNANGVGWETNLQGYWGFPTYLLSSGADRNTCNPSNYCGHLYPDFTEDEFASPATVTYQEAFMADAWGATWTTQYPTAYVSLGKPTGSPGSFAPMQEVLAYEIYESPTQTAGDRFFMIDGSNDYVDTWFISMYPNNQFPSGYTGSADVANAQAQIISNFGTVSPSNDGVFYQVSLNGSGVGTCAGSLAWNWHHGFLEDDVSTWNSTPSSTCAGLTGSNQPGSGVSQFLSTVGQAIGGW